MTIAISLGALVALAAPQPAQAAGCDVVVNETTSEAGFTHPGIGITASEIRNLRTQCLAPG